MSDFSRKSSTLNDELKKYVDIDADYDQPRQAILRSLYDQIEQAYRKLGGEGENIIPMPTLSNWLGIKNSNNPTYKVTGKNAWQRLVILAYVLDISTSDLMHLLRLYPVNLRDDGKFKRLLEEDEKNDKGYKNTLEYLFTLNRLTTGTAIKDAIDKGAIKQALEKWYVEEEYQAQTYPSADGERRTFVYKVGLSIFIVSLPFVIFAVLNYQRPSWKVMENVVEKFTGEQLKDTGVYYKKLPKLEVRPDDSVKHDFIEVFIYNLGKEDIKLNDQFILKFKSKDSIGSCQFNNWPLKQNKPNKVSINTSDYYYNCEANDHNDNEGYFVSLHYNDGAISTYKYKLTEAPLVSGNEQPALTATPVPPIISQSVQNLILTFVNGDELNSPSLVIKNVGSETENLSNYGLEIKGTGKSSRILFICGLKGTLPANTAITINVNKNQPKLEGVDCNKVDIALRIGPVEPFSYSTQLVYSSNGYRFQNFDLLKNPSILTPTVADP